jgi:hypothetical protein
VGLAACLALAVGFLFPTNGGPSVRAATILEKLHKQIEEPELVEITLESIAIEEVALLDGHLQVSDSGVAGDLHVIVQEGEGPIEIDLALAISPAQSWLLIRKLDIPDPDVQPFLKLFFPPGTETLLLLPEDVDVGDLDLDLTEELEGLSAEGLLEAFRQLLEDQPDSGATMYEQRDGTIVMTLPILDAEALKGLMRIGIAAADEEVDLDELDAEISIDDDEIHLIGSTLEIVYDPRLELVRSFAITDFGANKGTIAIDIRGGEPDAHLFDAARVTTSSTRTFDLTALESFLEQLEIDFD